MVTKTKDDSYADRRENERVPLHLNVILNEKNNRPRGCRVLNVSQGGMFLEWSDASQQNSGESAAEHFKLGDSIEILFSFRGITGRKDLKMPAQVMRAEGKGIGISFTNTNPAITELLKTRKEDDGRAKVQHITNSSEKNNPAQKSNQVEQKNTHSPKPNTTPANTDNQDTDSLIAELDADLTRVMQESDIDSPASFTIALDSQTDDEALIDSQSTRTHVEKSYPTPMLIITFALTILMFGGFWFYQTNIEKQITTIQNDINKNTQMLTAQNNSTIPLESIESSIRNINIRFDKLKAKIESIQVKIQTKAKPKPINMPTLDDNFVVSAPALVEEVQVPITTNNPATHTPIIEPQPITKPLISITSVRPVIEEPTKEKTVAGLWAINIIALKNKASAEALVNKAEEFDIDITMETKMSNNSLLYHLIIKGLASRADAEKYARVVEKKLNIKSTWINRR